ncbi:hypothetical protein AAMO2058_000328700 [Amorphochlora amoebiformis]
MADGKATKGTRFVLPERLRKRLAKTERQRRAKEAERKNESKTGVKPNSPHVAHVHEKRARMAARRKRILENQKKNPRVDPAYPSGEFKSNKPKFKYLQKKGGSKNKPKPKPQAWSLDMTPSERKITEKVKNILHARDSQNSSGASQDQDIKLRDLDLHDNLSPRNLARNDGKLLEYKEKGCMLKTVITELPNLRLMILPYCDFGDTGRLARVCKDLRVFFSSWIVRSKVLASQAHLYLPEGYSEEKKAKSLFKTLLWPSRNKWRRSNTIISEDFKIRVAVRFRPSIQSGPNMDILLPLHQRVKLVKEGKLKAEQLFEQNTKKGILESMVESQSMDPNLIAAVLEASRLESATQTALRYNKAKNGAPSRRLYLFQFKEERKETPSVTDPVVTDRKDDVKEDPGVPELKEITRETLDFSQRNEQPINGERSSLPPTTSELARREIKEWERKGGGPRVLAVEGAQVVMYLPGMGIRPFHFDVVKDHKTTQTAMYSDIARDSVVTALNGFNAAIICYGQTGSGKTHTMFGPDGILKKLGLGLEDGIVPGTCGVVVRAFLELFRAKRSLRKKFGIQTSYVAQYVQIYNEQVTDLLSGGNVTLAPTRSTSDPKDVNVHLRGASEIRINNMDEVLRLLIDGEKRKTFAATEMNIRSSRAHTILNIEITQLNPETKAICKSKLGLVDLAGSERTSRSRVEGSRLREAMKINISLMALARVIGSLVESKSHIPYFDSKLTLLLKSALQGNSRTTTIVTCRSDDHHGFETLSSIRFGQRAGKITNKARMQATSVEKAMELVTGALRSCRRQMRAMEERDNQGLKVYQTLKTRAEDLEQKLRDFDVTT